MKRLITTLLLFLASLGAAAQSTYGTTTVSFFGTASQMSQSPVNVMVNNLITVTQPFQVTNGFIFLGSGGTVGDKIDLIVVAATAWNATASSATCHATFTETTGTINAWVQYNFTGCTLSPGNYFIAENSNDPGLGIAFNDCGSGSIGNVGVCLTGSANQANTAKFGAQYQLSQPYGSYTGYQITPMNGQQEMTQVSMYVTGSPTAAVTPNVGLNVVPGDVSFSNNMAAIDNIIAGGRGAVLTAPTSIASTTFAPTGLALPTVPPSTVVHGHCSIVWEQLTAASTVQFGMGNSGAPTALWVTNNLSSGAGGVTKTDQYSVLTTTTAAVSAAAAPSAIATGYKDEIDFVLQDEPHPPGRSHPLRAHRLRLRRASGRARIVLRAAAVKETR